MRTWMKIVAWVFGVVGVVLLVLYIFFFDVWTVPSDDPVMSVSIEPTLSVGDVVVVTRHMGEPTRGNLLRCADPQAPGRWVVARAYARMGDKLEVVGEVPMIDGRRTPSPRACDPPSMVLHSPTSDDDEELLCSVEEYGEMTYQALRSRERPEPHTRPDPVEPGRWYMLSDNRHMHLDSRDYGQIDPTTCQHILYRIVGSKGFGDSKKRLSIIW